MFVPTPCLVVHGLHVQLSGGLTPGLSITLRTIRYVYVVASRSVWSQVYTGTPL